MGREANCLCVWNGGRHTVKALLEPPELILRGEIRRRIPFAKMKNVGADGDWLRFTFEGEPVAVQLGDGMAAKWADAMLKPPPTLAKKLGITPETTVRTIGPMDDAALKTALGRSRRQFRIRKGDLILARVDTPARFECRACAKAASETQVRHSHLVHLPQGSGASAE